MFISAKSRQEFWFLSPYKEKNVLLALRLRLSSLQWIPLLIIFCSILGNGALQHLTYSYTFIRYCSIYRYRLITRSTDGSTKRNVCETSTRAVHSYIIKHWSSKSSVSALHVIPWLQLGSPNLSTFSTWRHSCVPRPQTPRGLGTRLCAQGYTDTCNELLCTEV